MKLNFFSKPQRKTEVIAADTSRSRALEPVDTAVLHKSPVQHFMGWIHALLSMQLLVTKPVERHKCDSLVSEKIAAKSEGITEI